MNRLFECPSKYDFTIYTSIYDGGQSYERSICLTKDTFGKNDHKSAQAFCESFGSSLCSLKQMIDALSYDYVDSRWGMYNIEGRDARVTRCDDYTGDECYDGKGVFYAIPNTPRPYDMQRAYCCS
ncbi:uncharacterized protein [Asterias amurensis]|uniref:uncharacterized protein n=1 Tax=Asterias amurensis TaxID=7602 RepID=UPI003AB4586F